MTDENKALVEISNAEQALQRADDIQDIVLLRDKASAFQLLANAQGFKDAAQKAKIFQLKAERKAGEWLAENVTHEGGNPSKMEVFNPLPDGITYQDSHRWQKEAEVPEEKFNEWVDKCLETGEEISASGLQKLAKLDARNKSIQEQIEEIKSNNFIPPEGRFGVIVVDPPWPYGTEYDPDGRRSASPYPEMSIEELSAIVFPADDDCVLWLWTTHKFMRDSFVLLDAWGFRDVAILTWVKDRMGLGSWLRSQSEFCIMAVKGNPTINLTNQTTIINGAMREHSRKPDEFYEMVNKLCVGYRLDYFGRQQRDGWKVFGNDANKFVE